MIVGQNTLLNQYIPTFLIKNLVNGQILIYDSTRKSFINVDPVVSTSSIQKLGQLINVDDSVDSALVPNGQSLIYNSLTQVWTNQYVDYTTLLNKPTNESYSFLGLSDTANTSIPNGYVLWNGSGTQLVYSSVIPASSVTGLATVATTGNFNDLANKPTTVKIISATISLAATGTFNIGSALPLGATILNVRIKVTSPDTGSGTLQVGKSAGNQYMTITENDTQTLGLYISDRLITESASVQVQATVGGTPAGTGSATVLVEYYN